MPADSTVWVPVVNHLRAELERTPPEARTGDVVPEVARLYRANRDRVTDRVQKLFRHAGVEIYEPGTGPGTGKRAVLRYGYHSLRHSTATILQEGGAPAAVAEQILGHRSQAMRARYTHVGRHALASSMARMPAIENPAIPRALPSAQDPARAELHRLADTADIAMVHRAVALLKA